MTYLRMIEDGLAQPFPSLSDIDFLYLPESKLEEVKNIVNKSKASKEALNAIDWLYDKEHAQENNHQLYYAVGHCIGAAIYRHNVNADIYFVFGIGKPLMQSIYLKIENYYVVFLETEALMNLRLLCYRMKRLTPFAEMIKRTGKDLDVRYPGMPLVNIIQEFCSYGESVDVHDCSHDNPNMFMSALTYVVGHELAHIFNGHLAFASSQDFVKFNSNNDDENITQQTLEMDADSMATDWAIALRQRMFEMHASSENKDKKRIIEQIVYISGIYVANLYRDSLVKDQFSTRHPSGYARFLIAVFLTQQSLIKHYPGYGAELPELVRQEMVASFSIVADGYENLKHPFAINAYMTNENSTRLVPVYHSKGVDIGISQLDPLHIRWARMLPYLEKYRIGKPLAPAQMP